MLDIEETSFRVAREFIYEPIHRSQNLFVQAHAPLEPGALLTEGQIT